MIYTYDGNLLQKKTQYFKNCKNFKSKNKLYTIYVLTNH